MSSSIFGVWLLTTLAAATPAAPQAATTPRPASQQDPRRTTPTTPGQQPAPSGPAAAAPAPATAAPASGAAAAPSPLEGLSAFDRDSLTPEYRIAPGDKLQVVVWREADLTREVRVRPDGYVTMPLLGDLFAVAKTPKRLAAELAAALAQYVTAPQVTVTLGESSTLRFYVMGEVNRPGEFPLTGRTTVMQALALAGGFREYAKNDDLKLLRQELTVAGGQARTREVVLPLNYKAIAQGQNLQQNYVLKPGDVIVVP